MDLNTVTEIVPAEASGGDWREGDAWLAGGTWLYSEPQPGLRRLLDLTSLGWPALVIGEDGLEIAATCTLAELARFSAPPSWPAAVLFAQCCKALLGSFKVWNTATVGGNICLSLPAGPMISLAAALDGECRILAPDGEYRIAVAEFVTGPQRNTLRPGELLRAVRLPRAALECRTSFRQFSLTPMGRSAAVVIGRLDALTGQVVITVTAATARPAQFRFAQLPTTTELSGALAAAALPYYDDVHGDPRWRAQLTRLLAEEVRAELAADAGVSLR